MTQEIKQRLEQAAANFGKLCDPNNETLEKQADLRFGFVRGAQIILDNPGEFGLCSLEIHKQAIKTFDKITMDAINAERAIVDERNQLQSQLAEYRQALERILQGNCSPTLVAKEALKQH